MMICSLGLVSPGERHDIIREIFGGSDGTRTRDLLRDRQAFKPTELCPRKLTKNDFPLLPQPCSILHCLARLST